MRHWLLAALVLIEGGIAGWILIGTEGEIGGVIAVAVFLLSQWFFLGRRENWPVFLAQKARPLRRSVAVGALLAGALTLGVIAAMLEARDSWDHMDQWIDLPTLIGIVLVIWVGWAIAFAFLWPGVDRYHWLARFIRRLIVGSILELLASISVQALVPDRHDCACARGSFFGIVVGCVALLWAFGPGVALVFYYEKVRMARAGGKHCVKCEYDLRGTLDAGRTECPECGTPIAAPPANEKGVV